MLFTSWRKQVTRPSHSARYCPRTRERHWSYSPQLDPLEDRTLPAPLVSLLSRHALTTAALDLAIAPDNRYAVVRGAQAGADGIAFFRLSDGVRVGTFQTATGCPLSLSFGQSDCVEVSPDSTRVVAVGDQGADSIQIYDFNPSRTVPVLLQSYPLGTAIHDVAISPDSRFAVVRAAGAGTGGVTFYRLSDGTRNGTFWTSTGAAGVDSIAISPDSRRAIITSGAGNDSVQIYDTSGPIPVLLNAHFIMTACADVKASPNNAFAVVRAAGTAPDSVSFYDLSIGGRGPAFSGPLGGWQFRSDRAEIAPNSTRTVVVGEDDVGQTVQIFNTSSGMSMLAQHGLSVFAHDVAISADSRFAAVTGRAGLETDDNLTFYDLTTGARTAMFRTSGGGGADSVVISPDSTRTIVTSGDGFMTRFVRIYDTRSTPQLLAAHAASWFGHDVAVSSNGQYAVVRLYDGRRADGVTVYDLANGSLLARFYSDTGVAPGAVTRDSVEISRNSSRVVVIGSAGTDTVQIYAATDAPTDLVITGTTANDTMVLRDRGTTDFELLANGQLDRAGPWSLLRSLTINGLAGNDAIQIQRSRPGIPVTVNGGDGNDTVTVGSAGNSLDAVQGSVAVNGDAGSNTLLLNDQGTTASQLYLVTPSIVVRINMATFTATGPIIYGTVQSLRLNAGSADDFLLVAGTLAGTPVTFSGGGGSNYVIGPDAATTWAITSPNAGALTGAALGASFTFTAVGNLVGNTGTDTYVFANGVALSGLVYDLGGAHNRLDYTAYTTGVYVNLVTWQATGTTLVYGIQDVTGGSGNDILVGDDRSNVLDGGPGRDLLIAGGAGGLRLPDTLLGGAGEDILIAGFTSYDADAAALAAILAQWTQATPYATRVNNLLSGTGAPRLDATTVFYNYASYPSTPANTLLGGAELDLFFGQLARDSHDRDLLDEVFVEIS